jgi:ATP-dependent RNA helicase RhlE
LFSATLNDQVSEVTLLLLHQPIVIKVEKEETGIDQIIQTAYAVSEVKKGPLLRYLIKTKEMKQVLIFVSSTFRADAVVEKLRNNKINAVAIHSKKSQAARTKSLENFKLGRTPVLVATDLISRGIDIEFLPAIRPLGINAPVSWFITMASQSRIKDVALIFGNIQDKISKEDLIRALLRKLPPLL